MKAWRTEIRTAENDERYAVILFDTPGKKQNILTSESMAELDALLDVVPRDCAGLVIASAKDGTFIAGADIMEIDSIRDTELAKQKAREGQRIFAKLASLPMPTAAAINGYCLGGGCELALACDYRVGALGGKFQMGLPETKLGILPGFGGTQRLPKLIGIQQATEMILAGKLVDVEKALKIGMIDRAAAPALLVDAAIALLSKRPEPSEPKLNFVGRIIESRGFRHIGRIFGQSGSDQLLDRALAMAEKRTKGAYPAMPATIDVLKRTVDLEPDEKTGVSDHGQVIEAEAFAKLVITDVSVNLRTLFFLDEAQKKYAPYTSAPLEVKRAAVLGAGIMGGGIGWAFSSKNIPVRVKDVREEALLGALRAANDVYASEVKRRKMKPRAASRAISRISVGLDYAGFRNADLIVEAVVEKMDVKKSVLAEVEGLARPDTVLATNTSGLSINEMASALKRPEKFGGLHFFNPVHRMPLVEIIRGSSTSDSTIATLFAVARRLGKTPILVRDMPGFLVNRILIPYMLEAARMIEEGVPVEKVDAVAEKFGMPMGPARLADEVGLDIGLHVANHLEQSFGERMKVPDILRKMVDAGLLGKKNSKGFYLHSTDRKGKPSTEINEGVARFVTSRSNLSNSEIESRLFLTMYLEAVRCLEDKVVERPDDVEIGMIFGTGFPPFRGGLLRWGASLGYATLVKQAASLREKYGDRYVVPEMARVLIQQP